MKLRLHILLVAIIASILSLGAKENATVSDASVSADARAECNLEVLSASGKSSTGFEASEVCLWTEDSGPDGQTKKDTVVQRQVRFKIYYVVNSSQLDTNYMYNRVNLSHIRDIMKKSTQIDSIVIYSYASPEGPTALNRRLSKQRGVTAKNFILDCVPEGKGIAEDCIRLKPEYENWKGLRLMTETDYHRPDRDKVVSILDGDRSTDSKKWALRRLERDSWRFIADSMLTHLRYAEWVCTWKQPTLIQPASMLASEPLPIVHGGALVKPYLLPKAPQTVEKTILALHTNLLYDLATWLNFSVEVPFAGNRFSVKVEHQFPWWRGGQSKNEFCMRYLQTGGEARWWFHPRQKPSTRHELVRDRLSGHFLGVYGMGGKYDFENKRKICYQGEFWSTGLTYGYSLPIAKRLNMEFSISMGYASIPFRHYIPSEDYSILFRDPTDTGTLNYFGVTKLGVTLVVPITVKRKVK